MIKFEARNPNFETKFERSKFKNLKAKIIGFENFDI